MSKPSKGIARHNDCGLGNRARELSSNTYTVLRRIDPPEKCYLSEVLLWRAFGRFPEMLFDSDGKDWRFSSETLEGYSAPIPGDYVLTEEECLYAGIPNDPQMTALMEGHSFLDLDHYDKLLQNTEGADDVDPVQIAELKAERDAAIKYYAELEIWQGQYSEYVDQFQGEICLKLRRGELRARGTKLPNLDPEQSDKILEKKGLWLSDLEVMDIAMEHWISQAINWEDSAIYGRAESFVWIHVKSEEMLQACPPQELVKPEQLIPVGANFALASSAMRGIPTVRSQRGRPALPWQDFHIEVARMFRDDQMPIKKEAAIAHIQGWFLETLGKSVSRAAVGERLKPYFDRLIKK